MYTPQTWDKMCKFNAMKCIHSMMETLYQLTVEPHHSYKYSATLETCCVISAMHMLFYACTIWIQADLTKQHGYCIKFKKKNNKLTSRGIMTQ